MKRKAKVILFLSDSRGIYIPQAFAEVVYREDVTGIDADTYAILEEGPEDEWYWEAWEDVLRDAIVTGTDGTQYTVYQDGDCWLVEREADWDNFDAEGFDGLTVGEDDYADMPADAP